MVTKLPIQERINAILDRQRGVLGRNGLSYQEVLEVYNITETQFYYFVAREIKRYFDYCSGKELGLLKDIHKELKERKKNNRKFISIGLFDMGEDKIIDLYEKTKNQDRGITQPEGTKRTHLPRGTFYNIKNLEYLVYHALTKGHKDLGSENREKIINHLASNKFPSDLYRYFEDIGLGGLMMNVRFDEMKNSEVVLHLFDQAYISKTKEKSLFDTKQKSHIPIWEIMDDVPAHYWERSKKRREVINYYLKKAGYDSKMEIPNNGEFFKKIGLYPVIKYYQKIRKNPVKEIKKDFKLYHSK